MMIQNRQKIKLTILGSGSSGGVPRIDGNWGVCDPNEPKNKRTRCSLLMHVFEEGQLGNLQKSKYILIDTSPDLRNQLLNHKQEIPMIHSVLYTHAHADQLHGIDDLRAFSLKTGTTIPIYTEQMTLNEIKEKFRYCFETSPNSIHPPILTGHELPIYQSVSFEEMNSIHLFAILVKHGPIKALGFKIENFAYIPDVSHIYEKDYEYLSELDVLIIDALRYKWHPSHANLDQALKWIEILNPKRAILTNLHIDLDYQTLKTKLSHLNNHIEPAYDFMEIEL